MIQTYSNSTLIQDFRHRVHCLWTMLMLHIMSYYTNIAQERETKGDKNETMALSLCSFQMQRSPTSLYSVYTNRSSSTSNICTFPLTIHYYYLVFIPYAISITISNKLESWFADCSFRHFKADEKFFSPPHFLCLICIHFWPNTTQQCQPSTLSRHRL